MYNGAEAEFEIKRLHDCCASYRAEIERLEKAITEWFFEERGKGDGGATDRLTEIAVEIQDGRSPERTGEKP